MRRFFFMIVAFGVIGCADLGTPFEPEECEPDMYLGSGYGVTPAGDTVTTAEYWACVDTLYVPLRLP